MSISHIAEFIHLSQPYFLIDIRRDIVSRHDPREQLSNGGGISIATGLGGGLANAGGSDITVGDNTHLEGTVIANEADPEDKRVNYGDIGFFILKYDCGRPITWGVDPICCPAGCWGMAIIRYSERGNCIMLKHIPVLCRGFLGGILCDFKDRNI